MLVLLARNVLQTDVRELGEELPGLVIQALEGGVLHPVPPGQLLDKETAVGAQQHVRCAEITGPLQAGDGRTVLGHVVRGDPDSLRDLRQDLALHRAHHRADPRRPRIAAGRAVAGDDHTKTRIRRQYSHLFTPCVRLDRSNSMAESFWWHPWHTPSTSAATPTPRFCRRRSSYSSRSSSSTAGTSCWRSIVRSARALEMSSSSCADSPETSESRSRASVASA